MIRTFVAAFAALLACASPAIAGNVGFPASWKAGPPCTARNAAAKPACRPADTSGMALAFDDEFDALDLGPGRRWQAGVHVPEVAGDRIALAGDPAYAVTGGALYATIRPGVEVHLQTTDAAGRGFTFTNGYLEMRAKLPAAVGWHGGIWGVSYEAGQGHFEFDVAEAYGPGDAAIHASSHDGWGPGRTHVYASYRAPTTADIYGGWHTYGLLATASAFTVYVDGRQVGSIARQADQHAPMNVMLSLFKNTSHPTPAVAATMLVDYVRVYTPPAKP